MTQLDRGPHDCFTFLRVFRLQVVDEQAVDLEFPNRKIAEIGKRREASTEVINRDG